MAWTRRILRAWSALCLALVLYGATPHVHHAETGAIAAGPSDATGWLGDAAAGPGSQPAPETGLRRDDAHESHSSTASPDDHPCTLCRDKSDRQLAAPGAILVAPTSPIALRIDRFDVAVRVELLLARRHPARAPPLVG